MKTYYGSYWSEFPNIVLVAIQLQVSRAFKKPGINQWEFQDPKMEVPTIHKAYVREYHHKIWPYGTVPPFSDPGIPIEKLGSLLRRRLVHWDDAAQKSGLSV